jgi:hypothetical protein
MNQLLETIRSNLSRIFTSEEYDRQRRQLIEAGGERAQQQMHEAQREAEAAGFALGFSPAGANVLPLKDGRPMTPEEFGALSAAERATVHEGESALNKMVNEVGERLRAIEREVGSAIQELDRQVVAAVVTFPFDAVKKEFGENEEVTQFLEQLREFTLKSADFLRQFACRQWAATPEATLLATVASGPTLDPLSPTG